MTVTGHQLLLYALGMAGLWAVPGPVWVVDKEQESKKKMREFGKVDIPQEAFIAALKMDT